jgi:hypothetical protein
MPDAVRGMEGVYSMFNVKVQFKVHSSEFRD